jgi:hypothetical protein
MEENGKAFFEELFSKTVTAGKRRYYIDVKSVNQGITLSMTESTRRFDSRNGKFYYERNKVIIYPQDLQKFAMAFREAADFLEKYLKEHPHLLNHPLADSLVDSGEKTS